ncbi:hypothetical protein [Aromatoleum anaerobium]|uniref:Bacteriophage/plasmid primase P4 C-terminal domain-containing protein n=1 Tax=Aromatoleum anaerobium TaxID=182180 RepID=A0ABX1PRZ7_9RHOO|nr:hypothetical protein [Aromatoleum anaerobium]MCK0506331.1 hypothetical protein [Aromatoleum anaerobium]
MSRNREAKRQNAIASGVIPQPAALHPVSLTPATDDVEPECGQKFCVAVGSCICAEPAVAEAPKVSGNVVPLHPMVSRAAATPDPLPWANVCFSAFYARDPDAGPHDVERHAQAADRVKKGYGLDADGRVVKVQPKGFWHGEAHRHTIGLDQLHEALARNKRSDLALLTAGVHEQDRITLPYAAQRAKDELPFPVAAGLLTIDSDELESWRGLATPADVVQVLAALGLDADCITSPSSSSYLQWPTGSYGLRGLHTFFAIDSGAEIPRVLDVLFRRAWLAGYGRILISGSGVMLERSIVDRALASGNQPIFERGAVLKDVRITQPRLVEKRRGRQRQVRAADILPLTETEEREYNERVRAAKELLAGDAARARREWAERLAAHLPEDKRAERVAQLSDLAEKKHRDLPPDFLVTLNDGEKIAVAEIVARRDEFDRRGIRDPFEPEYGANKATIFTKGQTDGRVKILSRAHGLDVTYYLEPKPADLSAFDGDFSYAEPMAVAPGALVWRSQDGKRGRDVASKARDKILPSLRGRVAWAREAAMWHVWNGTCWTPQGDGAVAHKRLHDAVEIGCSDLGFNPDYVMSIEKLLRMGDCLPLPEWDDGQQVPFRNGVLNLHTRELTASNPQHGNTWALPYDYTPDATCPRISDWLREAMGGG